MMKYFDEKVDGVSSEFWVHSLTRVSKLACCLVIDSIHNLTSPIGGTPFNLRGEQQISRLDSCKLIEP
jgi:hypothetical protein